MGKSGKKSASNNKVNEDESKNQALIDEPKKETDQQQNKDQAAQVEGDEEPISKVSVNKYDPYSLKSSIDEEIAFVRYLKCLKHVSIQLLEDKGFKEDNKYTDLKILVALIACVLGVVSHFYPIPFPLNKTLLIGCVIGYIICASLYYYIENKLEGDAFYIARSHEIKGIREF